jgi:carbon-monoxide dehydrogenase medium subunit
MKASAFSYARATSIPHALQLLASHGDKAKVLSGGQSLMPAMNLRLVSPEWIIDIGRLDELRGIVVIDDTLRLGALTRHVDLAHSKDIAQHAPLLADAIAHVAHPAIRNRGTVGGSLAHADPASELPACMLALNAVMVIQGQGSERRVAAKDFFTGICQTALAPEELLIAVEIPLTKNATHYFHEFARRHGDYAMVGLAAQAVVERNTFADLRLAYFGVGDRPVLAAAANMLRGVDITPAVLVQACEALDTELEPQEDQQASAAMRLHLTKVLLRRAVGALLNRPDLVTGAAA